jgi:3-phenylpropionate/cinnamic acid dioxygenase small subunit
MRPDTLRRIEQFLYREARLLDDRRYNEWLNLLAEDIKYWMPMRSSRFSCDTKAIGMDRDKHDARDITAEMDMAYLDETKKTLSMRIARLATGMAWAEEPPSRTRHIITNIEAEPGEKDGEMNVYSNFVLLRSRLEDEEDIVAGQRQDVLRPSGDDWLIARRKIVLIHNVLKCKNLSSFF